MVCLPLLINDDDNDDDNNNYDNRNYNDKVTYTMYKSVETNNSDAHQDTGLVNRKIDTQYTSCQQMAGYTKQLWLIS